MIVSEEYSTIMTRETSYTKKFDDMNNLSSSYSHLPLSPKPKKISLSYHNRNKAPICQIVLNCSPRTLKYERFVIFPNF